MKKKFFAVALATTMALSTVMTASAETLTGTAWWTGMKAGQDYALNGDGSITLTIKAVEGEGAAFSVETYKKGDAAGNFFFTSGSDGNAWFAEAAKGTCNVPFVEGSESNPKVTVGDTYEVTVTRAGKEFTVVYYDVTKGAELCKMTGSSEVDFPSDLNVHVMAQVGTFEVAQKTTGGSDEQKPADNGATTAAADKATTTAAADKATTKATTAAKTGDVAPVAALAAVAVVACAAVVVSRKKVTE